MNYINKIKSFIENKLLKKGNFYCHLFFIIIAFFWVGRSIGFHFLTHYINGGDTYQWLNFNAFIKKSLFIWDSGSSGRVELMTFTPFVYNVILKLIQQLTQQLILSINIYWIIFIYFLQISFFYFFKIFFDNKKALVATLLTFFNTVVIINLSAPLTYVDISLAALPLMFFLLHSFVFRKKIIYAFLYIIFQIVLFRALNILFLTNLIVPTLLFLLFRDQIPNKKVFWKKVTLVWLFSLMVCAMSITNMASSFKNVANNQTMQTYNDISLSRDYMDRFNLLNTFRLTNHFSIADNLPEFPGLIFYKFSNLYMQSWFYIFISFLFFGLLITNFVKNRKDKRIITLMGFLLALIFLAKSLNPPGQFINQWLYSKSAYLMLFRSGSKYFMYSLIPLAILTMFLGNKKFKLFYSLVFLYIAAHMFLIFYYAKPVLKYWDTTLPPEYFQITKKLDTIKNQSKILILPISVRATGGLYYDDGYAGPSRLTMLSSKDFIYKDTALLGSDEYMNIFNSLPDEITTTAKTVDQNANVLGYEYIVLEKDSKYYFKVDPNAFIRIGEKVEGELNTKVWNKVYENAKFALYKIKDGLFDGKIKMSSAEVSFQQINSAKYKLYVHGLHNSSELSFLEAFNPGWKLYLEPNPTKEWCQPIEHYTSSDATECSQEKGFFPGTDIAYLWGKTVFEGSHSIAYNYANSWLINADGIKKNFGQDYYHENPDGTIDIEITIYFMPQSYFYIGLLISSLTIMGCVSYLIFRLVRRKKILNTTFTETGDKFSN